MISFLMKSQDFVLSISEAIAAAYFSFAREGQWQMIRAEATTTEGMNLVCNPLKLRYALNLLCGIFHNVNIIYNFSKKTNKYVFI